MLEELWIMLSSYKCPLMDKEQKRLLEEVIEVEKNPPRFGKPPIF